jgi:hypothetical protein
MSEKYIRENKNSCTIYKSSKNYGKFRNLDDAILARDILIENDWDIEMIPEIIKDDDDYIIAKVIEDKLHFLARYKTRPTEEQIQRHVKKFMRNPNNSKYGLNISRIFETFIIQKMIAGDDYIFGYYDNLEDAEFVRNFLMDHMWNVNELSQIEYDDEHDNYKIIEVIDDKAYVIDSYKTRDEINMTSSHEKFLNKISKHKLGLASHPYLDELTDSISELEERFNVKVSDDTWSLDNTQDPLNDIIFTLTPWQKTVYDAVNDSTIEEIEKSLSRYRSKNFTQKIEKNLNELIEMKLIRKNQDVYIKRKI